MNAYHAIRRKKNAKSEVGSQYDSGDVARGAEGEVRFHAHLHLGKNFEQLSRFHGCETLTDCI